MPLGNNTIDFFTAAKISAIQDTTIISKDSVPVIRSDSTTTKTEGLIERVAPKQIELSVIDSILRKSEERERQFQQDTMQVQVVRRPVYRRKLDTTEALYKQFGIAGFPLKEDWNKDAFNQNFLFNAQAIKPVTKNTDQSVFIEEEQGRTHEQFNFSSTKELVIKPKQVTRKVQFDWITILLIISFLLIGWVRLFNKKYLVSIIKAVVSYKESNALYREKNSLMEKASFLINLLFINNIAIFCLQLMHFYNITVPGVENYVLYFAFLGLFIAFNVLRIIFASFIGYLFLKQRLFFEYIHNIFLYVKNMGLYLFPVIIILQFLPFDNLYFITYLGIAIILILYVIQIFRAFQIIIRKNVSIFFMILYLCAFEFTPFLVIYKVLLTQV